MHKGICFVFEIYLCGEPSDFINNVTDFLPHLDIFKFLDNVSLIEGSKTGLKANLKGF